MSENVEIQKLTNNKEIIAYLAEKFPLCFSLEGEAKPLKIGIFQDLAEALADDERVSKTQLRHALRQYTANWRYLHGCKVGAVRVDLQGNDCGALEQEHAAHAAQQLAEAKAKLAEKRAAERAANPDAAKYKKEKRPQRKSVENQVRSDKPKAPRKPKLDLVAVDMATLKANSVVKVKAGERTQNAIVLEVLKDAVRVQLDNGLVINVTTDRLFA
ncbi:ProP effector [Cricetibacter osteomyelitidis]|uniref:RNA chaperone ProQ n=1 Tax=Cricetibacter osteomyelitidis TaxID=1521931 RepID=A0A4R2SY01_9PAST|nr:RNA chaperone ProQ [Cricetibacter osteomyelitidis]TCP93536.1 ProP effector [Cricetibacter osteomyelitidis]